MKHSWITRSVTETYQLARKIALESIENADSGRYFLLTGDIGAGKTAFVRGFVSAWEMEDLVTSPTFTLINEYRDERVRILHLDLYRLNSLPEIEELGLEDDLSHCDYAFIEWPEIAAPILPGNAVNLHFQMGDTEESRIITWD